MFTNPKPLGYVTGERLPSAHVNTVWANVALALDGGAGGTYAPSSLLTIGGSGFRVSGPFSTTGTTTLGDAEADTVTVNGDTTFVGDVAFDKIPVFNEGFTSSENIVVNGLGTFSSLTVTGNTTIGDAAADTHAFEGAFTYGNGFPTAAVWFKNDLVTVGVNSSDTLNVLAVLDCDALITASAGASITAGNVQITAGNFTVTAGTSSINKRIERVDFVTDAAALGVDDTDHIHVLSLAGDRNIELSHTNAALGMKIVVSTSEATNFAVVKDGIGGSTLNSLKNLSGDIQWIEYTWGGSGWIATRFGERP